MCIYRYIYILLFINTFLCFNLLHFSIVSRYSSSLVLYSSSASSNNSSKYLQREKKTIIWTISNNYIINEEHLRFKLIFPIMITFFSCNYSQFVNGTCVALFFSNKFQVSPCFQNIFEVLSFFLFFF